MSPDEARTRAAEVLYEAIWGPRDDSLGCSAGLDALDHALDALLSERQDDGSPLAVLAPYRVAAPGDWKTVYIGVEWQRLELTYRKSFDVYRAPHQEAPR